MHGFQWWMIFPVFGMGFGFFGMWLRHRCHAATLDLIKTYLAQGKEPPQELLNGMKNWEEIQTQAVPRAWRRVTTFGSLAAGFGVAYLVMVPDIMSPSRGHPFLVVFIIMTALTVGALLNVLIQRKFNVNEPATGRE